MRITILSKEALSVREQLSASEYGLTIVRLREPPPGVELGGAVLEVSVQLTLVKEKEPQALLVLSAAEAMNLGADLYNAGRQAADTLAESDGSAVPQPVSNGVTTHRIDEEE